MSQCNCSPACSSSQESHSSAGYPVEVQTGYGVISEDPQVTRTLSFPRGQYRLTIRIPYDSDQHQQWRDLPRLIKDGDELKRVHIHKLDIVPTTETFEGTPVGVATMVFTVQDNLPILVWAVMGAAGLGGSWAVIDKAESAVESVGRNSLGIAVAIATLAVLVWGPDLFRAAKS